MTIKRYDINYTQTGASVYGILYNKTTNRYLSFDGLVYSFIETPTLAEHILAFTEETILKGNYKFSVNLLFPDGKYILSTYVQVGGTPDPIADIATLKTQYIDFKFDTRVDDLPTDEVGMATFAVEGTTAYIPYKPMGLAKLKDFWPWQWRLILSTDVDEPWTESITPFISNESTPELTVVISSGISVERMRLPERSVIIDFVSGKLILRDSNVLYISKKNIASIEDLIKVEMSDFELLYADIGLGFYFNLNQDIYVFENTLIKKYEPFTKTFIQVLDTVADFTAQYPPEEQYKYNVGPNNPEVLPYHYYRDGKIYFVMKNPDSIQRIYSFDGVTLQLYNQFHIAGDIVPSRYQHHDASFYVNDGASPYLFNTFNLINDPDNVQELSGTFYDLGVILEGNNSWSNNQRPLWRIANKDVGDLYSTYKKILLSWTPSMGINKNFDSNVYAKFVNCPELGISFLSGFINYDSNYLMIIEEPYTDFEYGYYPQIDFANNTLYFNYPVGIGSAQFVIKDSIPAVTETSSITKAIGLATSVKTILPSALNTKVGIQTGNISDIQGIDGLQMTITEVDTEPGIQATVSFEVPFDYDVENCTLNVIGTYDGWDASMNHHVDVKLYNFLTEQYEYTLTEIELESMDERIVYSSKFDSKFIRNDGAVFLKLEHSRAVGTPLQPGHLLKIEKMEIVVNKVSGGENIQTEFWA